jgi:hypothetical protein
LSRTAQEYLQPKLDAETLQFECEVLSLWILSLAIPDDDLKNMIDNEYFRWRNFDNDDIEQFCEHLNMRYRRYYHTFNHWREDFGAHGPLLGSVLANALKTGESDKLVSDPLDGAYAFTIVMENFKSTLEFIADLKKKYDLSEVSSVFVAK